jgi:hypothetical protein
MHIPESHHFENILETGPQPMGRGGGFRLVVFTGRGFMRNDGGLGLDNWRCGGNMVMDGDSVRFAAAAGCKGVMGCMKSKYDLQQMWWV